MYPIAPVKPHPAIFIVEDQQKQADTIAISDIFLYQQNEDTNETLISRSGILEENYNQPTPIWSNVVLVLVNTYTKRTIW